MRIVGMGVLVWLALVALASAAEPDVIVADFEGPDYGAWQATGEAFGSGPARGSLPGQMAVDGFIGKGLINSFLRGDGTTGELTSPPVKLQRRYVKFLIGGGNAPGKTCINLKIDGQVVRTATGPNDKPGGTERLEWRQWEVGEFAGRDAVFEIVDQAVGGWGHINIDQIVQTDAKLPETIINARREILVEKRYLNLPVKTGAAKRRVSLIIDGRVQREFEIELADARPEWWAFLDLAPFAGKSAVLQVDQLSEGSRGLAAIEQADEIRGMANAYRERLRPQVHFSPLRGWTNDPNGLVYFEGEWHLYFQHNPYGWNWGNMHWGHAVSADLVHWKQLPIALYPQQFGDWAFSGSAVVDTGNTSGFGAAGQPALVAAYTSTGRGECIVYSTDRGRTWAEFTGNPVVKHAGRDPRLLWHAPRARWVMAVYDETDKTQNISFYSSANLKEWSFESRIDGFFECPDLYELPVDGDPANTRWVLSAADGNYLVGRFDGKSFTKESEKLTGNYGNCFYAAQTFSNALDGRRIIIGWLRAASPNMAFNQCMSIPAELSLRSTPAGLRLACAPVKEFDLLQTPLRGQKLPASPNGEIEVLNLEDDVLDVRAEIDPGKAGNIILNVRGVRVSYNPRKQEISCLDRRAAVRPAGGKLRLRAILDRTTMEVWADDGLVYMPVAMAPDSEDNTLKIVVQGGAATATSLEAFGLKSAWGAP